MSQQRRNKKLYIYLALVTMAAVSLFARPIKRWRASRKRSNKVPRKPNLRILLGFDQQKTDLPKLKKKKRSC